MSAEFDTFIFVPAYNVEKTLAGVLSKIPECVWRRSQVLVIDDGSWDGTRSSYEKYLEGLQECIADSQARSADLQVNFVSRLRYFRFEKNSGYGAVVKKGLSDGLASGAKFIACLHGDGQYPADLLDQFLDHLENFRTADGHGKVEKLALLQGSRHANAGGAKAGRMPLHKRMGGAFLTGLENLVFRQKLTDRHSGFILYSAEFLRTVDIQKLSPSFDIDLELISVADARGFAMGELPIPTVYADEKSNLNVVTYGLRCIRQVVRRAFAAS
ncbi:MAG: glycosyltransferase family 2 protein [Fibrobacter sp.]|nr:glycosyltransferase family 2 protein [Fibrobacter sp.]